MINDKNEKYLKAFGKNLRRIRSQRKISQEALGLDAGLTKNHIGMIERGELNVSLSTIKVIADTLKLEPKILLEF